MPKFFMPKKIRVIAVGKIKEQYLQAGILEYKKRLAPFCDLEFVHLKDKGVEREGKEIFGLLDAASYILDAAGQERDSVEFSRLLEGREKISFVIGGPDGICADVKKRAKLISLSKMTFTHEMCALVLLEQVYRGFMILKNKPYHRQD